MAGFLLPPIRMEMELRTVPTDVLWIRTKSLLVSVAVESPNRIRTEMELQIAMTGVLRIRTRFSLECVVVVYPIRIRMEMELQIAMIHVETDYQTLESSVITSWTHSIAPPPVNVTAVTKETM